MEVSSCPSFLRTFQKKTPYDSHQGPTWAAWLPVHPIPLASLCSSNVQCPCRASSLSVPSVCSAVPCTLAPHPPGSLLRCCLRPLVVRHGLAPLPHTLLIAPFWACHWVLVSEGTEHPASMGGCKGLVQRGTLPLGAKQIWGSFSGSALLSAIRLLPQFSLTPGLCPHWRALAPARPQAPI